MTFAELIAAAEHGAASIYHAVVATGEAVIGWESSPVVAPLLDAGVAAANSLLGRVGVSPAVITADVSTALKLIAAKDATVPSAGAITGVVDLAGSVASALVPGAAGIVAGVESASALVEGLVSQGATISTTVTPPAAS